MKRILLAGATGYLGKYILNELQKRNVGVRAIVRNPAKLESINLDIVDVFEAEITQAHTLENCCDNIETVISTVGITRQKDGLTYMDVDYQANMNLLREAQKRGVRKFVYVSVLNGGELKNLKICEAKERFVEELKTSGLDYCIIRPNGFFSDMTDFYKMAKKGSVYLFGTGNLKMNPIHGEDLAKVCTDAIGSVESEINIGGPEILSHNKIASIAFSALNKKEKISHFPDWTRKFTIWFMRVFTSPKTYGPIEFFLSVMGTDMIAPKYGSKSLSNYFQNINKQM